MSFGGADSAHFQQMMERETRSIRFPDGIDRLITMERRWWKAYDTVGRAWGFNQERERWVFAQVASVEPPDGPDFERLLHDGFVNSIRTGWRVFNQRKRCTANENPSTT